MRKRQALGAAAAIVAVLLPLGSAAAAEDEPAVRFDAEAAIGLGAEPVTVTVVNDSTEAYDLSISAKLATGDDGQTTVDVPIANPPDMIDAADSVTFSVGPVATGDTKGAGFVVVTATGRGETIVARRALSLAPATPVPAVKKWLGESRRLVPPPAEDEPDLPALLLSTGCGSLSTGTVVVTEGKDTATLAYACEADDESSALTFTEDGEARVGKYEGTLKVGDTEVSLTYLRTTHWIWPILVILIGFVLAGAHQAWVNNDRPIRRAKNRLDKIGDDAITAQGEFERKAKTGDMRGWQKYTFQAGALAEVKRLGNSLQALEPPWARRFLLGWVPRSKADQDEEYKEILKEMTNFDASVKEWPSAAKDLAALDAAAEAAAPNQGRAQKLVERARNLLQPSADAVKLTLKQARELMTEVPKTTVAMGLVTTAAKLEEALRTAEIQDPDHPDYATYHQALRTYRQATAELAEADNAADVEKRKVAGLLETARSLLLQVGPEDGGVDAQATDEARESLLQLVIAPVTAIPRLIGKAATPVGQVRTVDLAWLLVALAVATWTGLAALYIDKPWGQWTDVVALLVWAFGATALLTQLMTGLENLVSGPIRLKKDDDKQDKK